MSAREEVHLRVGLHLAAEAWFEMMDPGSLREILNGDYRTTSNGFLVAAEAMFFEVLEEFRNEQ